MSRKKDRYFLEHHDEYLELFQASLVVETKKEMKRINKQIRERFGRGREIPTWERFPTDAKKVYYVYIVLNVVAILIAVASIILKMAPG
jgi:hypothetical protein